MHTPLADRLGAQYSLFAFSHCRDVVAAVTRAGGIGVLGAVELEPDELDRQLTWIEEQVGDLPYGVDLVVPASTVGQGAGEAELAAMVPDEHRRFLDELLAEHGVAELPEHLEAKSGMISWSDSGAAPLLEVALAHRCRIVANALGSPPAAMIEAAHERGVLVAALAGTARHAERHREAGVDVVVAQGTEAGGHTGEISTMVLVPEVVDAVDPLPVLAAGGIARGRQVAAALALGAQGVWTGSVWLTTEESDTHPVLKQKLLAATTSDTVRSRGLTGKPARQLRTSWSDRWDDPATPAPLPMPLQTVLIASALQRIERVATDPDRGAGPLVTGAAGQVVGYADRVRPVRAVVLDMVEEYLETLERLPGADD